MRKLPDRRVLAEVTATFPALPESIEVVHDAFERFFVEARNARAPLKQQDRVPVRTAGVEIANNIVVHACADAPGTTITVTLTRYSRLVRVEFTDLGRAYDPDGGDSSDGYGLMVARGSVDSLEYAREGDTNRWRLLRETGRDMGELGW